MLVAREIACLVYVDEDNRMKNKNAGKRLRERESEVSSEMSEQNKQMEKAPRRLLELNTRREIVSLVATTNSIMHTRLVGQTLLLAQLTRERKF